MDYLIKNQAIKIFDETTSLFRFAAEDFYQRSITTVKEKGYFSVVLSGGETPKLFLDTLVENDLYKKEIPWQYIRFFFGDERYVPATDTRSNFHMAYEHLFSKVNVNPNNVFRIRTEQEDPAIAAEEYETVLKKFASTGFDLTYLGLGDNAHTASLMPESDIVKLAAEGVVNQQVVSLFVPELDMFRITMTPLALNNSSAIIFLVNGNNKAPAVAEVIEGQIDPIHYPAQLINCKTGINHWYMDTAAAQQLNLSQGK
jgi:6-phosphogluconolactonase